MKTILAPLLLLIGFQSIFSQKPTVKLGPVYKKPVRTYVSDIVGKTEDGYLIDRRIRSLKAKAPILELYDENLTLTKTGEMEWLAGGKQIWVNQLLPTKDHIYAIGEAVEEETRLWKNYYCEVDPALLRIGGNSAELKQSGRDKIHFGFSIGFFMSFPMKEILDVRVSPDSSKILFLANTYEKKGEPEKYKFGVYDQQEFTPIWEKDVTLPYENQLFIVEKFQVDNHAKVYVMGTLFEDKTVSKRKGKPNYKYMIYVYSPGDTEPEEYIISLGDVFITDLTFRVADNGDLICAGFVSDKGTWSIKGITYFTIDGVTKQVKAKSVKEFGVDFLEQFMSAKRAAKGKELYEYALDAIIVRDDGGAILLAEQYYVSIITNYSKSGVSTTFIYHYNHIIVTSINPDGQIDWCIKVPKIQITQNDGGYYSSYATSISGNKIHLLFNENERNFTKEPGETKIYPFNGKGSVVAVVTIDHEGNMTKDLLFSNAENGVLLRPKVCWQVGPEEMIIYGEWMRKYMFGKVIFD